MKQLRLRFGTLLLMVAVSSLASSTHAQWPPTGALVGPQTSYPTRPAPFAVPDGSGGITVVWVQDSPAGLYAQRLSHGGAALWGASGVLVSASANRATSMDGRIANAIPDGSGGTFLCWEDGASGHDVRCQHLLSTGALAPGWPAGGVTIGDGDAPTISSDGAGGAIVVWMSHTGGPYPDVFDIYGQRVSSAGVAMWTANGVPVGVTPTHQEYPSLVTDGHHGALVTWDDFDSRVYVQRVDSTGARRWGTRGAVLRDSIGGSPFPTSIVPDNADGAIVTWGHDDRPGSAGHDVFAQRVNAAGSPLWTSNGIRVCGAAGSQIRTEAISDGVGGALVGWIDQRSGSEWDVYAQRIMPDGSAAAGWTANGVSLGTATSSERHISLALGSGGELFATWDDEGIPGPLGTRTRVQRLSSAGQRGAGWPAAGLQICSAAGDQLDPIVVSDASTGALVAWCDYRVEAAPAIYAQWVSGTGDVNVEPSTASADRLGVTCAPNPASGPLRLTLRLAETAPAVVEILDVSGRLLHREALRAVGPGTIEWQPTTPIELTIGVYFARVTQGATRSSSRFAVVR